MSDEPIPSLAEAMAEICRLRARVAELEAINAMVVGTLRSTIVGEMNEPATYTHDVPPSAPPHIGTKFRIRYPTGTDDE